MLKALVLFETFESSIKVMMGHDVYFEEEIDQISGESREYKKPAA